MLFDSNINVYEEANVNLQEFDFRARVNKPQVKTSKKPKVNQNKVN